MGNHLWTNKPSPYVTNHLPTQPGHPPWIGILGVERAASFVVCGGQLYAL